MENPDISKTGFDISPTPWGAWATMGFGIIVGVVFFVLSVGLSILFMTFRLMNEPGLDVEVLSKDLSSNGLLLSLSACVIAPVCIAVIIFFVTLRKGNSIRQYLHLESVTRRAYFQWFGIVILSVFILDVFTCFLGHPIVPDFMIKAYRTAHFLPLLWFAVVIAAPLFEEVFFRGFLFEGFQYSKLGPAGAILLTSFLWTIVHSQYDLYHLGIVFILGILLGFARLKTRSLYTPIVLHSLLNLIATIETALYVRMTEKIA